MKEATKKFVGKKFSDYYASRGTRMQLQIPADFWMREWGFVLFDRDFPHKTMMIRHKSFGSEKEIIDYLREKAPAHVYFSTAIYNYPSAAMQNKEWLGADLIFDFDADHIISEGKDKTYSYEEMLEEVKKETSKLIDFLYNDFGFEEEDMELVFSGSRGYHVHVNREDVRGFGSRERREIVDYVMATGLDMSCFLVDKAADYGSEELRRCGFCKKVTRKIVCPGCGRETTRLVERGDLRIAVFEGWGERLHKGLLNFLTQLRDKTEKEGIEELKEMGIGEKMAKKMMSMVKEEGMTRRIERMKEGKLGFFPRRVWDKIVEKERIKSADSPDQPVTADIKRLIRMPTSLHAKSGLEAKPLKIDQLKDFNPLEDAVVFGDAPIKINAISSSAIKMKGEAYKVEKEEKVSLPEHVALYFMCRGVAEII